MQNGMVLKTLNPEVMANREHVNMDYAVELLIRNLKLAFNDKYRGRPTFWYSTTQRFVKI